MGYDLKEIISHFQVDIDVTPYGDGHINDTYLADSAPYRYILQRINHKVFKDPDSLMKNVAAVTGYLREVIKKEGGDPDRETLTVIPTIEGKNYYRTSEGDYFRMYIFVENTNTYQAVENATQFYNAAKAFGKFQRNLADFDATCLTETIPNFHNTKERIKQLKEAIKENAAGRLDSVKDEVEFMLARADQMGVVVDALESGEIPLRVTHNDTKLNNVLFDAKTDKALCVIDLDTVMPGSLLYDYGDSLRFGASSGAEDEKDLDKIYFDLDLFEAYTKGFLEELGESITKREVELLPFSARLMTYECGIRFLADYLNGDTYFKIHYPEQNLDRCHTHIKLIADMEAKDEQMKAIVAKYYK
ncbi:MAG: aminoglycoside phosphotransferase family protein [Clostridia bacterium]|nr:aminoglycoside phosphotransferase family protein [Clostridia bacterium]